MKIYKTELCSLLCISGEKKKTQPNTWELKFQPVQQSSEASWIWSAYGSLQYWMLEKEFTSKKFRYMSPLACGDGEGD